MNIREFSSKELKDNKKGVESLINLYDNSGNCDMNGYLGDSVDTISFDKYGLLEFSYYKKINHLDVYSKGAILDSGIIIGQVQDSGIKSINQMYAWNKDCTEYTYIIFDSFDALKKCYQQAKKYEVDFTSGNISSLFSKLGISFDSVCQILLNQRVDNLNLMFNSSDNNIVSYKSL